MPAMDAPLPVIETVAQVRQAASAIRQAGERLAFVPTMGALHAGHIALVREAAQQADRVLVSIYVNPMQFGAGEDLDKYPHTLRADLDKLATEGVWGVFTPDNAVMYPAGFASTVSVTGVSEGYCGAARPGHFDGVATVVAKLFNIVQPDKAFFGEKDYQQLQVIRRMVADLNIPVEICGVGIVRDDNGLALSSRNAYLDKGQYRIACRLNKILFDTAGRIKAGEDVPALLRQAIEDLKQAGFDAIDYLDLADAETLEPAPVKSDKPLRLLAAARIGDIRLIDNVAV